jgi:hypothetical protein
MYEILRDCRKRDLRRCKVLGMAVGVWMGGLL